VVAGRLTRGAVAAHTEESPSTGQHAAENPTPAGYAMGGGYTDPSAQPHPEAESGYGATATYGNGGAQPYPAAGYTEGGPAR
jgi:hypothetical protein